MARRRSLKVLIMGATAAQLSSAQQPFHEAAVLHRRSFSYPVPPSVRLSLRAPFVTPRGYLCYLVRPFRNLNCHRPDNGVFLPE